MAAKETRPYQHEALATVPVNLEQGINRQLWKMPTGTGKTYTFAQLKKLLEEHGWLEQFPVNDRHILIIAHREELLDQAARTLREENPGLMVMVEQGDRHASRYADCVVASIQTLQAQKFARLKRILSWWTPRVVVVDEAHHAAADTYRTALAMMQFLPPSDISDKDNIEAATHDDVKLMAAALADWDSQAPRDRFLLGVTATPNRSDAVGLGCVFQTIGFSYDLKQAIADGWLVPIVPWTIESDTSLDNVRIQRGEFNQRELANTVNTVDRNMLALAAWNDYAKDVSTLGFTVDVAHAYAMRDLFVAAGIRAAAVSGETPKDDRRTMLQQYTDGQIDVIFNCQVLTEGTDLPRTGCILGLKPTKSASLYEQMVGRGLRLFPNKDQCIVLDIVDVSRKHSLMAAPVLHGLPPGLIVKGRKLEDVVNEYEQLVAAHETFDVEEALRDGRLTLAQLKAKAVRSNPWEIPPLGEFGVGRTMQWLRIGDDTYRIQYPWSDGYEVLQVEPDLIGQWAVTLTMTPKEGTKRQRPLATRVTSAQDAAVFAEKFIQADRRTIMKLKAVGEPWMERPASVRQIQLLKTLGATQIPTGLTMGRASQMIDLAKTKGGRR